MTIVSIYMPDLSGYLLIPGNSLTLKLTKSSDFSALNGAGDALAENGTSGWFSATVAEPWAERLAAAIVNQSGLVPRSGILNVGSTIIADGYIEGTVASGSSPDVMLDTNVASVSNLRTFVLSQGSPDNDCYVDQLVIISDAATANQKARVLVSHYVASTKTLTVDRDPVFEIAVGDRVVVIAVGERSGLISGFTPDGRAQLSAALTQAYDDGSLDPLTCIPLVSGSDWRIEFTNIGQLTGRTNLIFAIKNRSNDADSASLILVDTATGLKFVNGAVHGTPGNASIVVTDETAGTGYVLVKSAVTINLPSGQKYAGLKLVKASGEIRVSEPWRPCVTVLDGIVDANS
jgi:hypothetical protein